MPIMIMLMLMPIKMSVRVRNSERSVEKGPKEVKKKEVNGPAAGQEKKDKGMCYCVQFAVEKNE